MRLLDCLLCSNLAPKCTVVPQCTCITCYHSTAFRVENLVGLGLALSLVAPLTLQVIINVYECVVHQFADLLSTFKRRMWKIQVGQMSQYIVKFKFSGYINFVHVRNQIQNEWTTNL